MSCLYLHLLIGIWSTPVSLSVLPFQLLFIAIRFSAVEITTTFMAQDNFEENGVCIHESDMVEVLDESDKGEGGDMQSYIGSVYH